MNKHLLLVLLVIPLIAGCEANGSSSTQAEGTYEDSTSTDIGPTSDSSDPNFSVVTKTEPGIILDRIVYDLIREDCGHPSEESPIEIEVPPDTQVVSVSVYHEAVFEGGDIHSESEPVLLDGSDIYYKSEQWGPAASERVNILKIGCSAIEKHFVSPGDVAGQSDIVEAKSEVRIIIAY